MANNNGVQGLASKAESSGRTINVALVGPFASGKTTLLEAILARTGAISRQGAIAEGNTLGDESAEARAHSMSVEVNIADCSYLGDRFYFCDCPGSVEFLGETIAVLNSADLAVIVAEPDERKIPALQFIMKMLDEYSIPRLMFLNKIDKAAMGVRDALKMLAPASSIPLLLRQIPIRSNEKITGFIDLALQRAHIYREREESEIVDTPSDDSARQLEARFQMLETLADHDDALMEKLLEDIVPETSHVFNDLVSEFRQGLICPVFIGAAESGNGIGRLLKAIRHEADGISTTRERMGLQSPSEGGPSEGGPSEGGALFYVFKTLHTPHSGKLSVVRILQGGIAENTAIDTPQASGQKPAGLYRVFGQQTIKQSQAETGDIVAFGKLGEVSTGDILAAQGAALLPPPPIDMPSPVLGLAVRPTERRDEVKLSAALNKLVEEDPSLQIVQIRDTAETILQGQGEMHLRVAVERLASKFSLDVETNVPEIAFRETIRSSVTAHGRHKKQSGGHGQFGDVVLDIRPLSRGEGIEFSDTITGGVIPKQYIPSVEAGVREALKRGPLGFPVVDIKVTLTDGSFHSVDSSDQAFRMAGILAIRDGLDKCRPVLLESIYKTVILCPNYATSKINAIVSARRGQLLGFEAREGWDGWDEVQALLPEAEIGGLIVDLRSATSGVARYSSQFDHLAEMTGKQADDVVAQRKQRME